MTYTTAIPPHYRLKIKAKLYGQRQNALFLWEAQNIIFKVDTITLFQFSQHSTQKLNFQQIQSYEAQLPHCHPTVTISTQSQVTMKSADWGFRDFQLYYYPCPAGCNFCPYENNQAICSDWSLQLNSFKQFEFSLLTNDGWMPTGGDLQFRYFSCAGQNLKISGAGQGLKKIILLPPHFALRMLGLIVKIDLFQKKVVYFYIDDALFTKFTPMENANFDRSFCSVDLTPDYMDDILKFDQQILHSKQLTTLVINSTLGSSIKSYFGIRDFQLFVKLCDSSCKACTGPLATDCIENTNFMQFSTASSDIISQFTANTFANSDGWTQVLYGTSSSNVGLLTTQSYISGTASTQMNAKKTFRLSNHKRIQINAKLYQSGTASSTDYVYFEIDGLLVSDFTISTTAIALNSKVSHNYDHTRGELALRIYTSISGSPSLKNVGFREFTLYIGTCGSSCTTCDDTATCQTVWTLIDTEFFTEVFSGDNGWSNQKFTVGPIPISTCSGLSVVGGLDSTYSNTVGSKTITFGSHSKIRITMDLYFIGKWAKEYFYFYIDDIQIWKQNSNYEFHNQDKCGSEIQKSQIVQLDLILDHTSATSVFYFHADIDVTTEKKAWAFRNLVITQMLA